jgi:hypothetical protein
MRAVHRVMSPGARFVIVSFSRPEFFLDKLLVVPPSGLQSRATTMWEDIDVRELNRNFLYRFQKATKAPVQQKIRGRK